MTAMTETPTSARMTRWRWIAAIWFAGALFDASQTVLIMHAERNHHPWPPLFAIEFVSWLPWALATPLIIGLARRHPLFGRLSPVAMVVHVVAFAAIACAAEVWNAGLQVQFDPWGHRHPPTFLPTWRTNLLYQSLTFLIAYALILTVTFVVDSRDEMARRITEAARLNAELSQAKLAALRRQMEPHFMFNALNSIAGLVRDRQGDAAVNMIVGLSEFLRRAAEDSHRSQVTLGEEVDYLRRYLDIQKVRFGDRLRFSLDIPDDLLGAQVPNLLLQPLVENAIKHGVGALVAGGAVHVSGAHHDGVLRLAVLNDGPRAGTDAHAIRAGVGLDNLRTRLRILHGDEAALDLRLADTGEAEVVVTLPFKEA